MLQFFFKPSQCDSISQVKSVMPGREIQGKKLSRVHEFRTATIGYEHKNTNKKLADETRRLMHNQQARNGIFSILNFVDKMPEFVPLPLFGGSRLKLK